MVPPLEDAPWTAWMDRLMGNSARSVCAAELPRSLFYCQLEKQPDHLVPEYVLTAGKPGDGDLRLNPDCLFTVDSELPTPLRGQELLAERLALQGPVAWVPHPATGALQPFWLSHESHETLERLRSGGCSAFDVAPQLRRTLELAGVLVNSGRRHLPLENAITKAATGFREYGYAPFWGAIHPFQVAALRRYYRYRIRTGGMVLGDEQSSQRYVAHNESLARFFHHQLTPLVTAVAGEPVKPSYVYVASYQGGAKLEWHTDREQCEFSITFCLDYSPEPVLATPWPLQLHTKTGTVTVYQAIGDALLYRGCALPHSRDTLRQGQASTSIFFHYVRKGFTGPLD